MWNIVKTAGIFIFLLIGSVQDIREKRISVRMLILAGALFLAASLLFDRTEPVQRLCNMLPGAVAVLLACLTKEQIGYGDAAVLMVLGNLIPGNILLGAVTVGLFLLSTVSVILLTVKKADRKSTMPFIPFLSAGMLWQMISNQGF